MGDELERERIKNAQLTDRIDQLEAENERLRECIVALTDYGSALGAELRETIKQTEERS